MPHDLWVLLVDRGWALAMVRGSFMTVAVGALGMLLGLLLGFPLALVRWLKIPVASQAIEAAATIVRSVPGLLVIYLFFFGSVETADAIGSFFGFEDAVQGTYPFVMGVVAIGVIACAYAVEVFRGALQEIPSGLIEAGRALALPRWALYRTIVAPLMLRLALGGLNNVWQSTIKETSLVSVVGLQEVMRISAIAAGITRSPLLFYLLAALVFLAITGLSQFTFSAIERRLNVGFGSR
ncbi:ABC transporter permease subunit [Lichenihabitans psoromatis]|uniref:ABC transporter permease subunit n=1 Tax=Lichenihabitans psoromatis TaxID=2528642 RepID=UPI001036E4AA|nr:ABC transporter permease subunit [Lichenihabitans psoromatis]